MKVYAINEKIINLAEVQYIEVYGSGRVKKTIRFYIKNREYPIGVEVLTTDIPKILEKCYEIMKKED